MRPRRSLGRLVVALLLALGLSVGAPAKSSAQTHQWYLNVASWNLLNFSLRKATTPGGADRVNLLTGMGQIAGAYDILVFQEVLEGGQSVTGHLINYLPAGYACNHVSAASGRVGRQERYVVCAPPANAWGTIAIAGWTDYSTTGANYLAPDGTMQPAANVWMRPPVIARVTFTPNDATFPPVTFDIYTNHTKPAYGASAHARPPGTIPGAPNSSVVHYELQAIENNLSPGVNRMLIGDLNADCASYPVAYRGLDFAAWQWRIDYGTRTNTAVGSSCAYDRIILNNGLAAYYRGHGVDYDHYGNATRVDGQRVSDHYPVWVRLGQYQNPLKQALIASLSTPVTQANKQAKFSTNDTVKLTGSGLKPSVTGAKFYVTSYATNVNYKSNFSYALTDVRGAPDTVSTDASGNLVQTLRWVRPPAGAYVFVFDANGDGRFDPKDGDFANNAVQADILVTAGTSGHNDLVTLGDNMALRDAFDLTQAYNIYVLAKNLPPETTGNLYIVSDRLLAKAGYATWAAARAAHIALAPYSIPIGLADKGVIDTSRITPADVTQTFKTTPSGELFMSAWTRPAQLMNAVVNYVAPPASVFLPSYAGNGDPPASPDDTNADDDPCSRAYASKSQNFQKACNVGFLFSNYYGNAFNVVLDLDGDGKLSANDPVDTRDIGDMTTFFNGPGTVLGPNANGSAAVSEYKEYLSRALSVDLPANTTYDRQTMAASSRYACGPTLSKAAFQAWIVPDAETGFRVLEGDAYQSERTGGSGLSQYGEAFIDGLEADDSQLCISGGDLAYGGEVTAGAGSNITAVANSHTFEAATVTSNASTECWVVVEGVAGTALAVGAGSGFFTAGTGTILGAVVAAGANIVGGVACGL